MLDTGESAGQLQEITNFITGEITLVLCSILVDLRLDLIHDVSGNYFYCIVNYNMKLNNTQYGQHIKNTL